MSGNEQLALFTAGVQTMFSVPERPKSLPKMIQGMSSKVEQQRAKDAWNASCQLRLLIELWCCFLTLGMLRSRLDDATEKAISSRFPGLEPLAGVLNMLAHGVEWREEFAQALPAFDDAHQLRRKPTEQHLDDDPKKFGAGKISALIGDFRRRMLTDAECLHLLGVRKEMFQQPWGALRIDLERLTCIDMDFSGDRPQLNFGKTLTDREFQRVRGLLMRELQELVEQLETYPALVLERQAQETNPSHSAKRSGSRMTIHEAEKQVTSYLKKYPKANSVKMAHAIGISEGLVRKTDAWKNRPNQKPRKKGHGERMGLDIAVEQNAVAEFREREQDNNGGDVDELSDNEDLQKKELDRLIADQKKDSRSRKVIM